MYRLFCLLCVVSVFMSACGDQKSSPAQTSAGTQKVVALAADPAHSVHYVGMEAICGGQIPCYSSIQAAINDAAAGDTVRVLAGTYDENISLKSGVTLQGAGAVSTIINGRRAGSVVTAIAVDSAAKIDGFTLTGGSNIRGGGIYNYGSALTIANVTINGNTAGYWGGGIMNEHGAPNLLNVTISGNTAMFGGGIFNDHCSPTISNTAISGNTAKPELYGKGGGINNYWSSPTITNTTITGNAAMYGGGIYNQYLSSPLIYNTVISGNSATQGGGGIHNYLSASPTLISGVVTENTAGYGGGVYNDNNATLLVQNSIITANTGGGILSERDSAVTSNYNDFWNNDGYDHSGRFAGIHNIAADPGFIDAAKGEYRLQPGSPCIDAGSNAVVPDFLSRDIYGNPRLLDGNDDGTTVADIGAAEYMVPLTLKLDVPSSGVALQDIANLQATTTGARSVEFFVREPGGDDGIPIGYDNLVAGFVATPVTWKHLLDTAALQDGNYIAFAVARNVVGEQVMSTIVPFSIRNWATIQLLPATPASNAGRTVPVKFVVRVAANVDPLEPFVHNEGLEISIYNPAVPAESTQIAHYGPSATSYRIDDAVQSYITNYKTGRSPADYTVEIRRTGFIVARFAFQTLK